MVKEFIYLDAEIDMKDNYLIIKRMVMEDITTLMEINMMENGKMT